jgi:hypothetical protein
MMGDRPLTPAFFLSDPDKNGKKYPLLRFLPACRAAVMVDIDRSPAGRAGPAFPLGFQKRTDAVLFDRGEVVEHAHVVFRTVTLIQLRKAPARELVTGMVKPVFYLLTGKEGAVPSALPFRRITPPAPVLLPEKCHADGAVHAAGRDEGGPEGILPGHAWG